MTRYYGASCLRCGRYCTCEEERRSVAKRTRDAEQEADTAAGDEPKHVGLGGQPTDGRSDE